MSTYHGKQLQFTVFGQSHAEAIGVTIDGLPAGQRIDLEALGRFMARRAPGKAPTATARAETDEVHILCGLQDGVTCGAPLTAVIYNKDTRSGDYANLYDTPRPGHADFTAQLKYGGHQDVRGGGYFSGRLTAPLCIAGGICLQLLKKRKVSVAAHILSILDVCDRPFNPMGEDVQPLLEQGFPTLDQAMQEAMQAVILQAKAAGDSVGGIVECMVQGLPGGLGGPLFDGLESKLALLLFGIPAVKGVDFGAGFGVAQCKGSQNNDPYTVKAGTIQTTSNHHGGILGGISSGMPLVLKAAFKPTPSIGISQQSVSMSEGTVQPLVTRGRHDPCIVPRAVPVVEAVVALGILDAWLGSAGEDWT